MRYTGGAVSYIQLPTESHYDARTGWQVMNVFKGHPDAIGLLEIGYTSRGFTVDVRKVDPAFWEMRVVSAVNETYDRTMPLADQWTLPGENIEVDAWLKPDVQTELAKVTDRHDLAQYRRMLSMWADGEATWDHVDANGTVHRNDPLTDAAVAAKTLDLGMDGTVMGLFAHGLASGVRTYRTSQFTFRRVTTVGADTTIKPVYANVNRVFTSDQLTVAAAAPPSLLFEVPNQFWLKCTPSVSQLTSFKFQITQEWIGADHYDPFFNPPAI